MNAVEIIVGIAIGFTVAIIEIILFVQAKNQKKSFTSLENEFKKKIGFLELSVFEIQKVLTPEKIEWVKGDYKSDDGLIRIVTKLSSRSKDCMEFHMSEVLYMNGVPEVLCKFPDKTYWTPCTNGQYTITTEGSPEMDTLREKLFETCLCKKIEISPLYVKVYKSTATSWKDIVPVINKILFDIAGANKKALEEQKIPATETGAAN